ncbi:hypothetical protein F3J44_12895 [Pantoea sp. Tr-811]|uniref:hypothetical protein n=1 Tax=Pantoea sp. Tr-811 TaxID=2608361 RepID=UPI001421AC49|nr:hypothetical protein [Pantoea sp. Tr-811]NIF27267.1 hypothetical protein [Pantoea sp. Tr-811]
MSLLRRFALVFCLAAFCGPCLVVQAAQPPAPAKAEQPKAAHKPVAKPAARQPAKASKPKAKPVRKPVSKAVAQPLPKAKLDLSLPTDMVKNLQPEVGDATLRRKPLLPAMFTAKPESDDSPFQLNGRLISNEMQLQLRNDARREVDGAAIEFQFRN